MQNTNPGMDNPEQNAVNPGNVDAVQNAASSGTPFTADEWNMLVNTPLKVSTAMMAVSPSGPIGLVKEGMSIGKSIQTLKQQSSVSPVLATLSQRLTETLEATRPKGPNALGEMKQSLKNPDAAREEALSSCQQAVEIIRKASPQDANAYKQFVYSFALNIAESVREGGFLGIGGEKVSPPEKKLLDDLTNTLELQRS